MHSGRIILSNYFFDTHSLRINNIGGDANTEESVLTSPVFLPAAGKYALTAEVKGGPYNVLDSRLEIQGVSVSCTNTVSNMHLSYVGDMSWGLICEFDVAEPATVQGKIVVGTKDEAKNANLSVDEVDIRPIGFSGITNLDYNRALAEIKNGNIIEGRSKAIYSSAIKNPGGGTKIHNLSLVTNGINSENINAYWNGNLQIYDNYMEANGKFPLNRQYYFSMIDLGATSGGNLIYNNTLMNGPHVGIVHGGPGTLHSDIYSNTIKTKITATNGFAIMAGGNIDIYDNIIIPFQGHGINLSSASDNVRIYNNHIEPSTWPCSEYSTYAYPNSAHGIRIKNYSSGEIHNLEIFNNTIIGHTNPQLSNCYTEVSGITNYLDDDSGGGPASSNVKIHDNVISVSTDNYMQQHAIAYKGMGQGEVYQNTFKSNHIIVDLSDNDVGGASQYKKFDSNSLIKDINPQGFYTLRYGYQQARNNVFTNSILSGGADLKDISFGINNGANSVANYATAANFSVNWYLTINVKDANTQNLSGVNIEIYDKDNNIVKQLSSNTEGGANAELGEYIFTFKNISTKSYNYLSPYSVVLSKIGLKDLTVPINLDASKILSVLMQNIDSQSDSTFSLQTSTANPIDAIAPAAPTNLGVLYYKHENTKK